MPAIRKSFRASTNTTPHASPTHTTNDPHGKRQSLLTQLWSEPNPVSLPSYEEVGLARHGVLENMSTLGAMPSAKVKQRTRLMGETAARNSAFGKSTAAFGDDFASTPEVTPAPELDPDDSERQDEDNMRLDLPFHEEEEDDDYEPMKTKKKGKISKTPVRGKTPVNSKTTGHGKTPVKNGVAKSSSVSASPAVQPIQGPAPKDANAQRLHTAVNDAILRANKAENRRIGIAVKEMWQESQQDTKLLAVLEAVIHNSCEGHDWDIFRAYIKKSRKHQRNQAKRERLQSERENGRHRIGFDSALNSSRQASPRASSEVVPDDSVSAVHDTSYQGNTSSSFTKNAHRALQASIEQQPHPLSNVPVIPSQDTSGKSTPRMSSKSPRKKHTTNGHPAQDSAMDIDGAFGKTPNSPGGSDSELSEVNEDIVQKGPPEPSQSNGKQMSAAAIAQAKKVKSAAFARAAKKAKPSKLFGKHASKSQQPTPEQIAEEERAHEARQELQQQQLFNSIDHDFPTSEVRFDDEINDTESLTESQIAVGPPIDSDQPRRAGRVPQQGAKRTRTDNISRFSSPQLDSAAASRPSTPAIAPAPKRIKLNHGQAARTKRSPVKNREGGPIAGVAFNGGASRQLGPDDNDLNSPQSESDDYCSACRGTGEFVCCEGCPRVFHLLCCDPPRVDVPEGSFHCHECNARLGIHDDNAAETHPSLGHLFRALERTNARAFSLPHDLQNAFDGVTARPDGSYVEQVQKFPLAKNSGYGFQRPDYTRVFDGDQKTILCVQCGTSSGHKRQMLKCDFCHAHWHLDCLDPPLANPPNISLDASHRDAWRCPRHLEHDLRSGLLLQQDLNDDEDGDVDMADAAPAVRVPRKIRKPKNPQVIEPTFARGMRNNGLIELINDPDDEIDGEGNYVFGQDESKDLNSKVYRVPERGVIIDFLSKVKSARIEKKRQEQTQAHRAPQADLTMQNLLAHSMQQQQAALNLTRLAIQEKDNNLSGNTISALVLQLTSEAPATVVDAIDNAPPPSVTGQERKQLLKLQELIAIRLNG